MQLDLDWVRDARVNRLVVERRVHRVVRRERDTPRTAELLRLVSLVDLTSLQDDDTEARIRQLVARARRPIRDVTLGRLGADRESAEATHVAAICIFPRFIDIARRELEETHIQVAVVAGDFPAGIQPIHARTAEVRAAARLGVDEIDAVIDRRLVHNRDWQRLYEEVSALCEAAGAARLKMILASGELHLRQVYQASIVCMMAGADYIKTSTGREAVNATLEAGVVVARAIRDFAKRSGREVGLKPAGGIRRAADALDWLALVKNELGERYLSPGLFRIGASRLIDDIESELSSLATRA